MPVDATGPLRLAFAAAMGASAAVKALIGDPARIYDFVPDTPQYPYVTFGDSSVDEMGTKGIDIAEVIISVEVWDSGDAGARTGGYRGRKRVEDILRAVEAVLHHQALSVSGFALIDLHFRDGAITRNPEDLTWNGVHRYRALTQPTS